MEKIKANTTYYTRSIGDHNCIFELTVLSRTAKTALINYDNEKRRAKIYTDSDGREYLQPDRWSFALTFRAGSTTKPKRDWE
ncbi:hypothetical protein [Treponema sp.]|uniref:hypothetical protein n=1 Tax=Treponema sp. TaxID=166 RepID=UPI00298E963A|nr:hypothetical protein [Treponema sp.]MCR5614179.1 hypothetical protein [Treponema sp.]